MARPLNILVVNWQDRLNPNAGGAEEHLHQVFGRLVERGHKVTVLCSDWTRNREPGPIEIDGIEVHRVGGRYSFLIKAPLYFRRHLRQNRWDVVVEDLNKIPMLSPQWARSGQSLVLVHHLFGVTAFHEANIALAATTWLLERLVPFVYRKLPCVAVSESTRQDLGNRGLDAAKIQVIRNGVDLEGLGPTSTRYPEPTVVYLGRLKRYKRADLILKAIAFLRKQGVRPKVIVAGRGEARPGLEKLGRRLGITDQLHFAGFVPDAKKHELLSRAWVHVLTSPREGWGITSMEASACGTPTVASDSPGLRETVRHEETGLLVSHGNVPELAAALKRALDPSNRDKMGFAARQMAENYSWDNVADAFEPLLASLAQSGK